MSFLAFLAAFDAAFLAAFAAFFCCQLFFQCFFSCCQSFFCRFGLGLRLVRCCTQWGLCLRDRIFISFECCCTLAGGYEIIISLFGLRRFVLVGLFTTS